MLKVGAAWGVWWDEDLDIARVDWADGAVCGEAEARQITAQLHGMERGPVPLLVDIRRLARFDRPARTHFGQDDAASAIALLAGSPVSRMLANFFIGVTQQPVPLRMFTEEVAAVAWLLQLRT